MKASDTSINVSSQWNRVWQDASGKLKERLYSMEEIRRQLMWKAVLTELAGADMTSLRTIEIGAGAGTVSAMFAQMGARATVLDYSPEALPLSEELFGALKLTREPVVADALNLPETLKGQYDVSMSFGLAEHFENEARTTIIRSHFDLLRPGGLAVIAVPNARCYPYRWWKAKKQWLGTWEWGLEAPFSREELTAICGKLGIGNYYFVGSSFGQTLSFITPFSRWKKSIEKRTLGDRRFDPVRIPYERESWLGNRYGFGLTLIGRKPG